MFKILFIDDQPKNIETEVNSLVTSLSITPKVIPFAQAEDEIQKFQPDMIILDLIDAPPDSPPVPRWENAFEKIWKIKFCPVIVYSAQPELFTVKHALTDSVKKGRTGPTDLETKILYFKPHVDSINEAKSDIDSHFATVLRDIAPFVFSSFSSDDDRKNVLLRCGRRRLASFMDDKIRMGTVLISWERYLYPPISINIKLGDVLRCKAGNALEPTEFRLVLTPSCDMEIRSSGLAKVQQVLVAKCFPAKDIIGMLGLHKLSDEVLKNRLKTILTQGFEKRVFPLPSFAKKIPIMIADFKKLELIPIDQIGKEENEKGKEYIRIASLDSPFREVVSWAYMSDASRPGVPDCDFDTWRDEIFTTLPARQGAT